MGGNGSKNKKISGQAVRVQNGVLAQPKVAWDNFNSTQQNNANLNGMNYMDVNKGPVFAHMDMSTYNNKFPKEAEIFSGIAKQGDHHSAKKKQKSKKKKHSKHQRNSRPPESSGSIGNQMKPVVASLLSSGIEFLHNRYASRVAHSEADQEEIEADDDQRGDTTDTKGAIHGKVGKFWGMISQKRIIQALKSACELVCILRNLWEFSEYNEFEFQTPLIINMGLVSKAQKNLLRQRMESLPKKSQIDAQLFAHHKHLASFALKIYKASLKITQEEQAQHLGLDDPNDILYHGFDIDDDLHCPKFALLVDKKSKSVVLSIRGTWSIREVIIDIICDDKEFLNGFAHRGILKGMRNILKRLDGKLNYAMKANPGYNLVITGHSLGAGAAQLLAMELLHHPGKYIPERTKVECIALAPPPIFRSTLPVPTVIRQAIHIYVNNEDCVPMMSLASLALLIAMIKAVDALPYTNEEKLQLFIAAGNAGQDSQRKMDELECTLGLVTQGRFPYLEHPGQIYYLYKEDPSSDSNEKHFVVAAENKTFSKQIFILRRMTLDHFRDPYTNALKNVEVQS